MENSVVITNNKPERVTRPALTKRGRNISKILITLCVILSACSFSSDEGPVKLSSMRPVPNSLITKEVQISRLDFQAALENTTATQKVRLVPILKSAAVGGELPEYRLFGVSRGSPVALLGLEDADIIVAASDYVIFDPQSFFDYLAVMSRQSDPTVEVRRNNRSILFQYKFVG